MHFTEIKDITIPFLHDAAHVLSLRTDTKGEHPFRLKTVRVDSSGECAISYYGRLSEFQIKEIMANYCYPGEDKSISEINPRYDEDYTYQDGLHDNEKAVYTVVFTPNGIDYRNLKL